MWLPLQKKKGAEDAKGVTTSEFNDMLKRLLHVMESKKSEHREMRGKQWYLSYDAASIHGDAAQVIGNRAQIWPMPPHSPDCNKPIEHIHAQMDLWAHKLMRELEAKTPRSKLTATEAMDQATTHFHSLPADAINDDIMSLVETWNAIIAHDGGYPEGKDM